jgi:putative transposase
MHLILKGREYIMKKRLPNGEVQIKDILTEEYLAIPEQDIVQMVFQNEGELLGHDRNQDFLSQHLKRTGVSDLSCLGENDPLRIEVNKRIAYVEAVVTAQLKVRTEETLQPIIDTVAKEINDPEEPSFQTLIRWLKFFDMSGGDNRALVPATKSRGNRKRKFLGHRAAKGDFKNNPKNGERADKVAGLLNEAIDEVFLSEQRFTVQAVHDALVVKIDDANKFRDEDDQLPIPDNSSVYDAIDKLDDYEVIEARYGKEIADQKYRALKLGPRPTRPLERVECDHTKTDLFVVDPVMMLPIGRAFLTWLICVYTKMILGFYISFNPPSYLTVMECLRHAIRPKAYVKGKYPDIKNEWNPYGIPESLVVDNAREFHGRNLEDAARQLGIVIQFSPKGLPWFRQTVERSYGTVAKQLHHQLPGTTFSNILEKGDYDPIKTAIITPDVLDEITHKWIADVYQVSAHRGIKDIPYLRWQKGIAEWPPTLPPKGEFLDIALGYTEERVVSGRGIELDNLFYNDDDLAMLRRHVKPGKKVIVKRNPSDLSLIHVYDEKHNRYLPVPAVDQEYTKGLTLYQHTVISRYVREQMKRNVDIVALCRAKQEIQAIVEREWVNAGKAKRTRNRLARFRNEGVQSNREGIEKEPKSKPLTPSEEHKPRLLLNPASSSNDFENSYEPRGGGDSPDLVEAAIVREAQTIKASVKPNSNGKKSARAASSKAGSNTSSRASRVLTHASEASSVAHSAEVQANIDGEDDLDMTGWGGDYDLPKLEVKR